MMLSLVTMALWSEAMPVYEAWKTDDGATLTTPDGIAEQTAKGLLTNARFLWRIEAATWEEAMSIYNLRMGFGPYKPNGQPARCPRCSGWYYPEGSGECWQCG